MKKRKSEMVIKKKKFQFIFFLYFPKFLQKLNLIILLSTVRTKNSLKK